MIKKTKDASVMSQSVFIFCQTVIVQQMKLGGGGGRKRMKILYYCTLLWHISHRHVTYGYTNV